MRLHDLAPHVAGRQGAHDLGGVPVGARQRRRRAAAHAHRGELRREAVPAARGDLPGACMHARKHRQDSCTKPLKIVGQMQSNRNS